jgi:hypothetical protein
VRQELHVILCTLLLAATVIRREGWLAPIYSECSTHTFAPMQRASSEQHSFLVGSFPANFSREKILISRVMSQRAAPRIFHNAQQHLRPRRQTQEKVHFSFFCAHGERRRRCSRTAPRERDTRRAESSGMKNHVAKFTLLVGCVKNGLFAHA